LAAAALPRRQPLVIEGLEEFMLQPPSLEDDSPTVEQAREVPDFEHPNDFVLYFKEATQQAEAPPVVAQLFSQGFASQRDINRFRQHEVQRGSCLCWCKPARALTKLA
jgi:hypothetical protein